MTTPSTTQVMVVWDGHHWVVLEGLDEVGEYDDQATAFVAAAEVITRVIGEGRVCDLLVKDKTGDWREAPASSLTWLAQETRP